MTNAFRGLILSAALCLANPGAQAQDLARWGDLHGFLVQSLAPNRMSEVFFWLPDNPDPAQAREAIGVVYPHIEGSAGNVDIVVGHFGRTDAGFVLDGTIANVFGFEPRDVRFLPDRIEVTTTTLGPSDPRCCPTATSVWSISRAGWQAVQLR